MNYVTRNMNRVFPYDITPQEIFSTSNVVQNGITFNCFTFDQRCLPLSKSIEFIVNASSVSSQRFRLVRTRGCFSQNLKL